MGRAFLIFTLFLLCSRAHSQESCPWLTQGTAAALIGGDVTANVHTSAGTGSCEFSRASVGSPATAMLLRIAVSPKPLHECLTGEGVVGTGEDAAFCVTSVGSERLQIIRGRVRTTYFLVMLSSRGFNATDNTRLRRCVDQAAEEVAGSLF